MENVQNNVVAKVKPKNKLAFKKIVTSVCAGAMAVSMVAVNAFAEEATTSGFDYSGMVDAFSSSFTTMGNNILAMFSAVLPIGLGIMAMYTMVGAGKKIFTKLTG